MGFFLSSKKVKTKLLNEFKEKRILEIGDECLEKQKLSEMEKRGRSRLKHDLTQFPWPLEDSSYDLIFCHNVMAQLPDASKILEEFNRIVTAGGKIFIETPHPASYETHRSHRFSFGSLDYFIKGNPYYKTDFHIDEKYIFFDDLTHFLGLGFLANLFPRQYEKRFAFMLPATSFYVVFLVDK